MEQWAMTLLKPSECILMLAALLAAILASTAAQAQHQDVSFGVAGGQIVTNWPGPAPVWTDAFLAPGFPPRPGEPPVQQDDPGFNAPSGSFSPGTLVGLVVVQPLWYWDGQMLATPPEGTVFEMENALSELLIVDPLSVPEPTVFDFGAAGDEGGIHQHILFRLPDPVSPDGAYGIVLELVAPNVEPSDPFLIVLNQRLPDDEFDLGVLAILEASGILNADVLAGDYNANGVVEQADLDLVLLNWGADAAVVPEGWVADLPEGFIDQDELDGVLLAWGNMLESPVAAAAVPEPSTILLAIVVLISMYGQRVRD
jgi:hypothetical protein